MKMTEYDEIVASRKAEADQLIPMLKRQVEDARSETRKWKDRCELLEIELLRSGYSEHVLRWLYHNEQYQVS
jgi:hypothetical protein